MYFTHIASHGDFEAMFNVCFCCTIKYMFNMKKH